jgi:prevent-host-death family protein
MIRRLSSNQAKQQWGTVVDSVIEDGDSVIVESHGKPKLAVISYDEFQEFQQFKEEKRRAETLERFREFGRRIGNKNSDLSEEQIEELADRHSREFILGLAKAGRIKFERDLADYERRSDK